MREIIIFTKDELEQLSTPGREIEFKSQDGRTFVFMSEETFAEEYPNLVNCAEEC